MCEQLDEIKAILKETNRNLEQVSEKQKATAEMSKKNKAESDKLKKESEFKQIGMFWGDDAEATFEQATKMGSLWRVGNLYKIRQIGKLRKCKNCQSCFFL